MKTDMWYALRAAGTKCHREGIERHGAELAGAVRRAKDAGAKWPAIGQAAGVPWQRLRVLAGQVPTPTA